LIKKDTSKGIKTVGIMMDGKPVRGFPTPTRRIQVYDEVWPEAAKAVGLSMDDVNASPIAIYDTVPEHKDLADDRYIFSTFKWNVHTQGRSAHWKYNSEIIHTNPVFMHPSTGAKLNLKEGDSVRLSVFRPKGATYRSGEKGIVGSFENHVRFLKGMHEKVMMCSHHVGHTEHGVVARAETEKSAPAVGIETDESAFPSDKLLKKGVWWSKKKGGIGGGVHINDALPINPCPLTGGQNWYDNVCKIEKI
jgi:thiosulfate reductase/polysulfide reductase chain A